MNRHGRLSGPPDHLPIIFLQWMANIHQHHKASQGLALLQIFGEVAIPRLFHGLRYFGEAVTGQIHQATVFGQGKKVEQLCAPRCFAGAGQFAIVGQGIDGAGLPGIGSSGKRNFPADIFRTLPDGRGADEELSLGKRDFF